MKNQKKTFLRNPYVPLAKQRKAGYHRSKDEKRSNGTNEQQELLEDHNDHPPGCKMEKCVFCKNLGYYDDGYLSSVYCHCENGQLLLSYEKINGCVKDISIQYLEKLRKMKGFW